MHLYHFFLQRLLAAFGVGSALNFLHRFHDLAFWTKLLLQQGLESFVGTNDGLFPTSVIPLVTPAAIAAMMAVVIGSICFFPFFALLFNY